MKKTYKTGDWIENKGVVIKPVNGPAFAVYPKNIKPCDWWDGKKSCEDIFCQMPTLKQLQLIFENKDLINRVLKEHKGEPLKDECYWSSTESYSLLSWELLMDYGFNNTSYKGNGYCVRPVLAF